jgi:hypothetical protein
MHPNTKHSYSPKIEARRADYERLAESIIQMIELYIRDTPSLLDIVPEGATGDEPASNLLINALYDHLKKTFLSVDTFRADTIRKFYVELRLHADQERFERRRGRAQGRLRIKAVRKSALGA